MRIRPLSGQVLIELLPQDTQVGSIAIPESAVATDSVGKRACRKGIVRAMGAWRKAPNGYCILPAFGIGATVIVSDYAGTKLNRDFGHMFRMVKSDDVLAVLTEVSDEPKLPPS